VHSSLWSASDLDDEVIPPVPATPRTRRVDIWILGAPAYAMIPIGNECIEVAVK
jgi:hypothetical protein